MHNNYLFRNLEDLLSCLVRSMVFVNSMMSHYRIRQASLLQIHYHYFMIHLYKPRHLSQSLLKMHLSYPLGRINLGYVLQAVKIESHFRNPNLGSQLTNC